MAAAVSAAACSTVAIPAGKLATAATRTRVPRSAFRATRMNCAQVHTAATVPTLDTARPDSLTMAASSSVSLRLVRSISATIRRAVAGSGERVTVTAMRTLLRNRGSHGHEQGARSRGQVVHLDAYPVGRLSRADIENVCRQFAHCCRC